VTVLFVDIDGVFIIFWLLSMSSFAYDLRIKISTI